MQQIFKHIQAQFVVKGHSLSLYEAVVLVAHVAIVIVPLISVCEPYLDQSYAHAIR